MSKKNKKIIFAVFAVIIAIAGGWYMMKPEENVDTVVAEVVEYKARVGTIGVSFSADIKINGKIIDVSAPSQDTVSALYVAEGDHVSKGKVLGKFDSYTLDQKYRSAMATFNKAVYERNKIDQVSNPDQYRIAQQSVNSTYANVQIAKHDLDAQTVKSPISGTIVSISAVKGETSGNGVWITILKDGSFYGDVNLDETEVVKITKETPVRVTIDALEKTRFESSITSIGVVAKMDGSGYAMYPVKISIKPTKDAILRTGYEGTITFISKQKENVVMVPLLSVGRDGITNFVNVKKEEGTTEKRDVVTGFTDGKNVEISSGIKEGEIVVYEK